MYYAQHGWRARPPTPRPYENARERAPERAPEHERLRMHPREVHGNPRRWGNQRPVRISTGTQTEPPPSRICRGIQVNPARTRAVRNRSDSEARYPRDSAPSAYVIPTRALREEEPSRPPPPRPDHPLRTGLRSVPVAPTVNTGDKKSAAKKEIIIISSDSEGEEKPAVTKDTESKPAVTKVTKREVKKPPIKIVVPRHIKKRSHRNRTTRVRRNRD